MYLPRSVGRQILKEVNKAAAEQYRSVKDMDIVFDKDAMNPTQSLMRMAFRTMNIDERTKSNG